MAEKIRVKSEAKYQRISPRKVMQILRLVRRKNALEALSLLKFLPHHGARVVEEVLKSAVANAVHNNKLNKENLVVAEAYAGPGPTLHRWQPISRGRANPIKHRSSHVTIFVEQKE